MHFKPLLYSPVSGPPDDKLLSYKRPFIRQTSLTGLQYTFFYKALASKEVL